MRVTAEATRKLFIMRHGEAAFESIAKRYAEVGGDYSQVDLSSVSAWRDFAETVNIVPSSDVLKRAFLWCARHREPLAEIVRPTVPDSLEKFEDLRVLRQMFELYPHFIANSQSGFRCAACFDAASQFLDDLAKQPSKQTLRQLVARAESSKTQSDLTGNEASA